MYNVDNIKKKFSEAGLTLEIAKKPFSVGRGAENVFGLDITRRFRKNQRKEIFRMWPGHKDNIIQVMDVNRDFGQLVLAIKEEKREITVPLNPSTERQVRRLGLKKYLEKHPDHKGRIFGRNGEYFEKGETPANRRCLLLGLDERQMFMCTLPRGVSTVKQAHDSLKSTRLTTADGPVRGRTIRQGEWFFAHPSDNELEAIKRKLQKNEIFIQKKSRVFEAGHHRGGKPHVADELVRMPGTPLRHIWPVRQREEVYVRGSIRHPDHKTIKFSTWRKVFANNEAGTSSAIGGGTWID